MELSFRRRHWLSWLRAEALQCIGTELHTSEHAHKGKVSHLSVDAMSVKWRVLEVCEVSSGLLFLVPSQSV